MLMKIMKRRKQRGIGLLELMLSVSIIAILLVMATRYYKTANEGQKISNAISIISGIGGAGSLYFTAHPGNTFESIEDLVTAKYLPENFKGILSPWGAGSNVGASAAVLATGANGSTTVKMPNVPYEACQMLKANLAGTDATDCGAAGSSTTVIVVF